VLTLNVVGTQENDSGTRADLAFSALAESIVEGILQPGQIVNEAEWAERLGVSRGPVREAVRRLQGRRLVTREPYMKARVVSLEIAEVVEIFELREGIEGMACRLATQRMSDAEIQRLLDQLEVSRLVPRHELDFHIEIAKGSGNSRIIATLCDDLYYLLRLYRRESGRAEGRSTAAFEEHWQVLRAMKARDAQLAESLLRAHISRATRHLSDTIEKARTRGVGVE